MAAPCAALPPSAGGGSGEPSLLSDSRAASAAAGEARGAPRRRSDAAQPAAADGAGEADAGAAPQAEGALMQDTPQPPPPLPATTSVEVALQYHAALVQYVLAQIPELQARPFRAVRRCGRAWPPRQGLLLVHAL